MNRYKHLALMIGALASTACASEEETSIEPGVEPTIVNVAPRTEGRGNAVLTLYLHPDASSSAEVWLFSLSDALTFTDMSITTDVDFPIVLEPGDFARAPFTYETFNGSCTHKLSGSVYDTLSEQLTAVSAASTEVPGC